MGSMDDGRKIALVRGAVDKYNKLKIQLAKPRKQPVRESPAGKPGGEAQPAAGRGGSTIRDLLEQKEDQAVDGAFNTIFQEMVADDRAEAKAARRRRPCPQWGERPVRTPRRWCCPGLMMRSSPRPTACLMISLPMTGWLFPLLRAKKLKEIRAADETVEVDLGQIEPKKEKKTEAERPVERVEEEEITVDKLARIIQNMKYGISAALLRQLAEEIASLRSQHPDHYSVSLFMEVIGAVGRHLASHGDVAADLSRNMLQTVYDRLAHSLFTMQPQKNLLASHLETVHDYSKWHEQVVAELAERAAAAAAQAAAGAEGELSAKMTAAVKEIVRREVDELRKELLEVIENR